MFALIMVAFLCQRKLFSRLDGEALRFHGQGDAQIRIILSNCFGIMIQRKILDQNVSGVPFQNEEVEEAVQPAR